YGEHYRDFIDHVVASDCRYHIVGLEACQEVLRALQDPSLVHSSIEELLAAIELVCGAYNASSAGAFSRPSTIKRGEKISIDWSYLNWANTSVLAILVFVATVGGNFLSPNDSLIAAIIATPLFAAVYVSVRANFSEIFSSNVATPGLMGSWLKK
ncbi:MAG: hypothetical protein WAL36_25500, partial [Pseudolabrys sp.]